MDGLEKIREKVMLDSEARVSEILRLARGQAEKVQKEAQERLALESEKFNEESALLREQDERRLASEINMERRRIDLQAKNRLLDELKVQAAERLASLSREEKLRFYADLLDEAEDGDVLLLAEADRDLADELLGKTDKKLTLSEQTLNARGGLALQRGRLRISLSFEEILAAAVEKNITVLAELLYKDEA